MNTATTSEGLCGVCVQAAAAGEPPAKLPDAGRPARLRSPVGLGRAAVALLGLVIVTDLFALYASLVFGGVLDDLITGDYGADIDRRADRAQSMYGFSGVAQVNVLLVSCVVFIVWFYRVRVNAEVFEPHIHRKARGWTVGSWFVPVVNFWFPRRIALDIWDASSALSAAPARTMPLDPSAARVPHPLINAWWTLWVADNLFGRWTSSRYSGAEENEEIRSAVEYGMIADALDIAAAVLAIVLVLRLSRMQDMKARFGAPCPQPLARPFPAP
ncbi:hypothetical protein SALBM135S_04172 [Streptomyces alboniger]